MTLIHCHEPERTMLVPLLLLSLGAVFFGSFFELYFYKRKIPDFFRFYPFVKRQYYTKRLSLCSDVCKSSSFFAMLIGLSIAIYFYIINTDVPRRLANQQPILYNFLLNKWYFDELYNFIFVSSAKSVGNYFWKIGDIKVINGSIHGLGLFVIPYLVAIASRLQSGFVYHYALVMIIGFTTILSFLIFSFYSL